MGKINWQRVLLGGVLWAVVYNVIGAASWYLFLRTEWMAALQAVGVPLQESARFIVSFLLLTLAVGVFALWFYAAIRPRYGPGPGTAARAGFALWVIGALLPMLAWNLLFHFPAALLVADLVAALVAIVAATVAAAWPYQE